MYDFDICLMKNLAFFQGLEARRSEVQIQVSFLPAQTTGFPQFTPLSSTQFSLSEATPVGHLLVTTRATTARPGVDLTYAITGGNVDQIFSVDVAGQV